MHLSLQHGCANASKQDISSAAAFDFRTRFFFTFARASVHGGKSSSLRAEEDEIGALLTDDEAIGVGIPGEGGRSIESGKPWNVEERVSITIGELEDLFIFTTPLLTCNS